MTTKTYRLSANDIDARWHVLDAAGTPLGRVASEAAKLLLGKHKATYEPHLAMGDYVVVLNAAKVALTGDKTRQKVYYHHSGYPGGLAERTYVQQMARDPGRILERAIRGMLPHNVRGRELFRHLKVYAGAVHPHEAQFRAGTGERARKTAAKAAAVVAAPRAVVATEGARLTGSLARYRREELDTEARRLGIAVQSGWTKTDVATAIQGMYEANPVTA
ncbi:MAG: 50S ribosomal protein L13 [Dehalococcoidia bacterium]|nr:50S ribosomal protein L13 [Dehalococcoidia bacterium]